MSLTGSAGRRATPPKNDMSPHLGPTSTRFHTFIILLLLLLLLVLLILLLLGLGRPSRSECRVGTTARNGATMREEKD